VANPPLKSKKPFNWCGPKRRRSRLQSELSTRLGRVAPSTALASPAGPAVPSEARPTPSQRKSGGVTWLWAMSFCLLLMGLYQAGPSWAEDKPIYQSQGLMFRLQ